ncbi:MAG: fumarylacetoacetate hydrolase family protein [Litoreibacter sp.]
MSFVIDAPKQASVAVSGTDARFPVRRIFCVGRNYAAHAREMGNDERDPPFYFTKPADVVVENGAQLPYPVATQDVHHEIELVLAIGRSGAGISVENALDHVWGVGAGIDLTRRDIQSVAKKAGRPWDMAKGFDASAPMGALMPINDAPSLDHGRIWLSVDDTMRQEGDLSEMIWPVRDCISHLSGLVTLEPGDLVMTGTPAGVGPVGRGQSITAGVDGLPEVSMSYV